MGVRVDMRIDELILDGFPAARRAGIATAFRDELARLLERRLAGATEVREIHADVGRARMRYTDGMSDAAIGARIARATVSSMASAGRAR